MTYSLLFWILVTFAIVFDVCTRLPAGSTAPPKPYRAWAGSLLLFALIILLGLGIYGSWLHR